MNKQRGTGVMHSDIGFNLITHKQRRTCVDKYNIM